MSKIHVYELSDKGKRALSKKSSYKDWVEHDALFYFTNPKGIWCDAVVSGKTGEILDRDVHKSVDSFLKFKCAVNELPN